MDRLCKIKYGTEKPGDLASPGNFYISPAITTITQKIRKTTIAARRPGRYWAKY